MALLAVATQTLSVSYIASIVQVMRFAVELHCGEHQELLCITWTMTLWTGRL